MRRPVSAFAVIAFAAAPIVSAVPAHADPAGGSNGAIVIKGSGCGFHIRTPDGDIYAQGPDAHFVMNNAGKTTAVCNMDRTDFTQLSRAYIYTGWRCMSRLQGLTTDTKAEITPGGRVTITCKFH